MRPSWLSVCAVVAAFVGGVASAQSIITQWNFNSPVPDANTATGTTAPNIGAGSVSVFGGVTTAFNSGDASGGSSDPVTGDDSGYQTTTYQPQGAESGERGIEFAVSTVNFTGISLTWDQRHSNSASRWLRVSYSLDGSTFLTASEIEATLGGDTWYNGRSVDFSSIPGANNNPNFRVRIAPIFVPGTMLYEPTTIGSNYGTGGSGGGTNRFDMVTFRGTPIQSTPPTGTAIASPAAVCNTGGTFLLTVAVVPGASPTSSGITVNANLASLGGAASLALNDAGTNGDVAASDGTFSALITVAGGQTLGAKNIPITIADAELRSSSITPSVNVADCAQNASSRVVISQAFGGGGNEGPPAGTYNADFVELFNRSAQTVDLTGWSLQYASAVSAGGFNNTGDRVLLSGVIRPGQRLLVRMSDEGIVGLPLPTPDFSTQPGLGGMSNTAGRIALVRTSTLLGTNCASTEIEDLLGYGVAAGCFEGASSTPNTANDQAVVRNADGAQDVNQNFADFTIGTPSPRNRASGGFLAGYSGLSSAAACSGTSVTITTIVSAATSPASTGIQVRADLSQLGSGASVPLIDQGGGTYALTYLIPSGTSQGFKSLAVTTTDAQGRTDTGAPLPITVFNCTDSGSPVVISQVNGGGSNAGSTWNADFVEIFNRSQSAVSLNGWAIQYANADSVVGFNGGNQVNLSGSIGPGEYRLIRTNALGTNGAPIPTADFVATPAFGMDNQFGRVALTNTQTPLGPTITLPDARVVDFVGYGSTAINFEGLLATGTISNTTLALRRQGGCQDFNQNAVDFDIVSPIDAPRNSASPANLCPTQGGRCCIGARCSIVTSQGQCSGTGAAGAAFSAGAANCNTTSLTTPCCFADYNKQSGVTVQDIFDFLTDYFTGSVNANVAGDGTTAPTVQDIFDYLTAYFAGGC